MPDYGASSEPYGDQGTLVQTMANNRTAMSTTDVYWTGTQKDLTIAQNYFVGNTYSGTTLVVGGGTSLVGKTASMPSIQSPDYQRTAGGASSTPYTQAQVQGIASVAFNTLGASHIFWSIDDSRYTGTSWTGYILPGIVASGAVPNNNQQIPLNYMPAVTVSSVTVNSSTSLTPHWTALSGVGTNVTYTVYRNGTQIAAGQTGTSFVDTGLTTHTTYTYTVAMVNGYGTGPVGSGLAGTTS
jgi:hypothetical protein